MGRKCCVVGCRSNYESVVRDHGYTSCFQFPRGPERRAAWISAINRVDFTPSETTTVCMKHFEERFIIREDRAVRDDGSLLVVKRKHVALTRDAVPTLFTEQQKLIALLGRFAKKKFDDIPTGDAVKSEQSLDSDADNYMEWKMMGGHLRLKKGVLPHVFQCQVRAAVTPPPPKKKYAKKKYAKKRPCAVKGCKNKQGDHRSVFFYQFPKGRGVLLAAWRQACGRTKKERHCWVCSDHFSEDQIDRSGFPPTLIENAVPNVLLAPSLQLKPAVAATEKPGTSKEPETSREPETSNEPETSIEPETGNEPETSVETEIFIKEEPIDPDEMDINQPSTSHAQFVISGPLTPTLGVAYSVADLNKENSTSPLSNGDKPATNSKSASTSSKKRKAASDVAVETPPTIDSAPESCDSAKDRTKDQFDAYGEYIAAKLRKLDWKSCAYVQKAIGDIIFDAEMGKYKDKSQ